MKTNLQFMILMAALSCGTQNYGNLYGSENKKTNFLNCNSKLVDDPSIIVKGNMLTIANGDGTPSETDNTIFHSAQVIGDSNTVSYLVANEGAVSFNISNVQITGANAADFSVTTSPASTVLSGGKTFFIITFNPSAVGVRRANVEVTLDAPSSYTYTFAIQGTGVSFVSSAYNTSNEVLILQDFESSSSSPVWNYTFNSGSGSILGGAAYAESGSPAGLVNTFVDTNSLQVINATTVVAFDAVNTKGVKDVVFSASLGSYSLVTSDGSDSLDHVTVSVSTNAGASWSDEIIVKGSSNAKWSFTSGNGVASSTYSATGISANFSPSGNDYRTSDGYGTLILSGLPSVADLRIRLTIVNNDSNEIWAIDNIQLAGKTKVTTIWDGTSWSAGAPDNTKKAIINSDYTTANGNIEANSIEVSSEVTLTVTTDHYINSQTDVVVYGSLVVNDGGIVYQVDDYANNIGNATVKRCSQPVRRFDFTYWSSPVGNQTLYNLSPLTLADKYFSFNPVAGNWAVQLNGASLMTAGKGYIVRAPQSYDVTNPSVYSANFYGTLNNGVVSVPIDVQSGQTTGWNLIGNPYPSALRIDDFLNLSENQALVDGTIYLWTHNSELTSQAGGAYTYTSDDYAAYNFTGGITAKPTSLAGAGTPNYSTPTGYIASGQSFFVKGIATGTAVINNSMRMTTDNNQFFKTSSASAQSSLQKNRVWLDIKNSQGAFKQTLVGYIETATNGMDTKFDGTNLNGNSYLNFYSLNAISKLSIQGRALPFVQTDIVPLGYYTSLSGTFTISANHFDGLFSSQNIYLEDKLLNVIHDLKVSPYSFTTNTGTFDTRFVLRYTNTALSSEQFVTADSDSVAVVTQSDKLIVRSLNATIKDIVVNDILGKQVFSQNNIEQNQFEINQINQSNQELLISIICSDGKKIVKKVLF